MENKIGHTPAPWRAVPRDSDNDGSQDERAGLGWDVEGPPEATLRGQFARAADAKLAAAAPELLEALLGLRATWAESELCFCPAAWIRRDHHLRCLNARAAISKAIGGQE